MSDQDAGLLLCIGITADELVACRQKKTQRVLDALKSAGVYPYTDLSRLGARPVNATLLDIYELRSRTADPGVTALPRWFVSRR